MIGHGVPGDDGVAVAVARIASQGRAAWPAVAIADDAIAARIARLVRDDPGVPLDDLHAASRRRPGAIAAVFPCDAAHRPHLTIVGGRGSRGNVVHDAIAVTAGEVRPGSEIVNSSEVM